MKAPTPQEIADALKTVAIHKRRDPVNFYRANFFQQRLYHAMKAPQRDTLTVVLALKPNRVGGSFGLNNILSAIIYGTANPNFAGDPFGPAWPFLKAFRLFSTSENLADVGALQLAMAGTFPKGRYAQSRGVGKGYNSSWKANVEDGKPGAGWTGDMFSYGQDALSAAGANKGLVLFSEPPPRALFTEGVTRLSGNGVLLLEAVQLDLAPWLEEMAEEARGRTVPLTLYREVDGVRVPCADPVPESIKYGSFKLDGVDVGEIRVVRGDVEDACREHSNGHMAHSAVEAMVAAWPAEEREARRRGKPLKLSGRIYPNWGDANELDALPAYHAECWAKGEVRVANVLDPADARPWALTWFAGFPNEDVIAFAEWPTFDYAGTKQSPVTDLEDYRDLILETDAVIGRAIDNRFIDPLFGNAPGKGNARTLRTMLAGPCRACMAKARRTVNQQPTDAFNDVEESPEILALAARECGHRLEYVPSLAYHGSVRDGHILVRAAIGGGGRREKIYAMRDACPNFCIGMRRYAPKIEKNPDRATLERPQLAYKDFPDLIRYLLLKRWEKWPLDLGPAKLPGLSSPFKPRAKPKPPADPGLRRERLGKLDGPTRVDKATYDPRGDGRPGS